MTKRRIKSHGPKGLNKNLGSDLAKKLVGGNSNKNSFPSTGENVSASITHETDLEEFFNKAQLAGTNFKTVRDDPKIISSEASLSYDLNNKHPTASESRVNKVSLIPKRPFRDSSLSKQELDQLERSAFLEWRRSLETYSQNEDLLLNPYERNLEIWRQFWRVIERSDIVIQIVDARNPLFFYSNDLDQYVRKQGKKSILLINKSDLITKDQILSWRKYFESHLIDSFFWSASHSVEFGSFGSQNDSADDESSLCSFINSPEQLVELFRGLGSPAGSSVVGMIGYPNVGKSSTINKLAGAKKTTVSVTPGKTKHLQTIVIDDQLTLCDCPGLILPSFVSNESEMVLNGILPISQLRDSSSPVQLLFERIPSKILEERYSILVSRSDEFVSQINQSNMSYNAHDFLTSLAFKRGFMSSAGIPDCSRAARFVLSEVVSGNLKWVVAPPKVPQELFDRWTYSENLLSSFTNKGADNKFPNTLEKQLAKKHLLLSSSLAEPRFDAGFFISSIPRPNSTSVQNGNDNCYNSKKHWNKNKKEKLRRKFAHLNI